MTRFAGEKHHPTATFKAVSITVKPRKPAKTGSPTGRKHRKGIPPLNDSHWTDTLLDGTHVLIRPIEKTDIELERAFIKFLSPDARRMRFLGQTNEPGDDLLRCLTDIDYKRDMAFVALIHRDGETREVGVSRYGSSIDGKSCECAVTVADAWRHRGLAVVLMRHLIDHARGRGIREMVSFDAAEDAEMRALAAFLGFERKVDPRDPKMVVHTLKL